MSDDEDLPPVDRELLRKQLSVLQDPLELVSEPYAAYAEKLETSQEEIFGLLCEYLQRKIIRRIAGVLKHNRAGFTVNAMVAMKIPNDECDRAGEELAAFPFITHCYRRTAYPDWQYTLYAMVHAKSKEEFGEHLAEIRQVTGSHEISVFSSLKEYKKTAFRIDSP